MHLLRNICFIDSLSPIGAIRGEADLLAKSNGDPIMTGEGERLMARFSFSNEGDVLLGGFGSKCSGRPLTCKEEK